jgi:hypothetical protein
VICRRGSWKASMASRTPRLSGSTGSTTAPARADPSRAAGGIPGHALENGGTTRH